MSDIALLNLENRRATYAHERVAAVNVSKKVDNEKYRSLVLSSGALLQSAGLMQTLAFYLSKGEEAHQLADDILQWICYDSFDGNTIGLFALLLGADDDLMARKSAETMALLIWLKRFTEATLKTDKPNKHPDKTDARSVATEA